MEAPTEGSNASQVSATVEQDATKLSFEARQQPSNKAYNTTNTDNPKPLSNQTMESLVSKLGTEKSSAEDQSLDVATRIPYENGYRDLCFGRLIDRLKGSRNNGDDSYWREGSNGLPVPELDASHKFGQFPFFKLPRDIRDKIYLLLLDPLHRFNTETKTRYKYMFLGDDSHEYEDQDPYGDSFDKYLEHQQWLHRLLARREDADTSGSEDETENKHQAEVALPSEECERQKQQYHKDKESRIHYSKPHPGRGSPYRLSIYALRNNSNFFQDNHDYILVDWIRQASNVSTEFRTELAEIIWSNVTIHTNGGCKDISFLPQLVRERPAASLVLRLGAKGPEIT